MRTNPECRGRERLAGIGLSWSLLGIMMAAAVLVPAAKGGHPELPLDLGSAGDFVILAKTGISSVPSSDITGDMGVSPIDSTAITGFSLMMDGSGEFSTSAQVTGKIYASDYVVPTPTKMTTAISDMETAFTQASLRTLPDTTELMAGDISGLTITPGLHKWSTDVLINNDVTLDAQGNAAAIFIFQISGDLLVASGQSVLLAAGAQARNIFWQIEGPVGAVVGTTAHVEGVILTAKAITIQTGASFNGKLLAQTRVDLDQNILMDSDLILPPQVILEIISEYGIGDLPIGIYTNDYGTLLTNTVTDMETTLDGGTQYVNTGWAMTGNAPALGTTNTMEMAHTNDAVLTWLWETNYLLNATAGSGGSVTGDANGFYAAGTDVTVTAGPTAGNSFIGWTGDFSGSSNDAVQNLTMDQARSLVANFEVNVVLLEIISDHGVADLPVGLHTNDVGTILTNTVTPAVETTLDGGTQYVNTGWSMVGNDPALGTTNTMVMAHTNDAVLTWQWSTNYLLSLHASNGAITNATAGWKPAGDIHDLYPVPDAGFYFDHWEVNGIGQGSGTPLNVAMDGARDVVAVFTPEANAGGLFWNVAWTFDPRRGFYIGTLTITNPTDSGQHVVAPFWFEVERTDWHWLRFPTGFDANTGTDYLDISPAVNSQLATTGNGDLVLDPGESVAVGNIELMGRRTTQGLVVAVLSDTADNGESVTPLNEVTVEMSPAGGVVLTTRRPVFAWPATTAASWYQLWITRNGQKYWQQWVQESTTWVPLQDMKSGSYRWWVQPWSLESGYGAWSDAADFGIALMLPGSLVQNAPSGVQAVNALDFRWEKDANATWYRLWVGRVGGGTVHDRWYAMSGTGEASVAVGGLLQGDYTWWVVGWSPDGTGPWAGPTAFSTPDPAPGKPVLVAPAGLTVDAEPLFEWQVAPKAEWYRVYVVSSSGKVIDQWTQAASLASPVVLASGAHSWWVGAWNSLSGRTTWSDQVDFTAP